MDNKDASIKAVVMMIVLQIINDKAENYNQADDDVSLSGR